MDGMIMFRIGGKAMSIIDGSELANDPVRYDGGTKGSQDAYAALDAAYGHPMGRGWSYVITTTREGAEVIENYCRTVGETFAFGADPDAKTDSRALLKVAEAIRTRLDQHTTQKGN